MKMKRLTITKLIVISQSESRSLEVPFSKGLNIILGGNKTGKSSIIKSIFTTFGCECRRVEKDWTKIISTYILYFEYGIERYCIVREKRRFQLFQQDVPSQKHTCLIETNSFHEYSNMLMQIFGVNMPCVSSKGDTFNITPPLLFRFQYIDQDDGWNKIGDSFRNATYIKDWKKNTNKYVCGYLSDEYYILRSNILQATMEKDELKKEFTYNQNFVNRLNVSLKSAENMESPENIAAALAEMLATSEKLMNQRFDLNAKISSIENDIFIANHKLKIASSSIEEIHKDINFAMKQGDELICPVCGVHYHNGLPEQLNISSDFALAEKLVESLTSDISALENELSNNREEYKSLSVQLKQLEHSIQQSKQLLSYSSFYKNEGKQEIYESCLIQLDKLQRELDLKITSIALLDERVKNLLSKVRAKGIREKIEAYCRQIAEVIDIPKTFIKLRDFVQVIDKSGSDTPRLVYMYQTGLYLYNLNRMDSPFNFFVVDTPNQQGQDAANLKNIYQSLNYFLSDEGQVILGTERETGCEDKAAKVIKLTEKRRCLNQDHFSEHLQLLDILKKEAIRWVHDNHQELKGATD